MSHSFGFVRAYVAPTLFLLALPLFSLWFFSHAENRYDESYRENVLQSVAADAELSAEEKEETKSFYLQNQFSDLCHHRDGSDPGMEDVCGDYDQFAFFGKLSLATLALGIFSLLFLCGCAGASFFSRPLQSFSFTLGWNFLRVSATTLTVVQGTLAVALSFWMTAVWFERYFVKLIVVAGLMALVAMAIVVKAIFNRTRSPLVVDGERLTEQSAPHLWNHVREVCERLGTEPPSNIIGGIDDNFFVAEGDVFIGNQGVTGRTLYVSLSLLRTLTRPQADAVLAHEMAHFSGGDTEFSKNLAPNLTRYAHYMSSLYEAGPVARPAADLALLYWALFQLSLSKSSREREFRADSIAAEQTSPNDVAHALVKVGAYSNYRRQVEEELFDRNRAGGDLSISARVVVGFHEYAKQGAQGEIEDSEIPHPFDTHPALSARAAALSVELPTTDYSKILLEQPKENWFSTIEGADEVEQRLWDAYEARFAAAHEESLAYRYKPSSEEEIALVTKFFPLQTFSGVKDGPLQISYFGLRLEGTEEVIPFSHIRDAETNERMFKKFLDLKLYEKKAERKKSSICLTGVVGGEDAVVECFSKYWSRHQTQKAYRKSQTAAEADS